MAEKTSASQAGLPRKTPSDEVAVSSRGGGNRGGGNRGGGNRGGGYRLVARRSGLKAPPDRPGRHTVSMGWHPDVPDFRDLTPQDDQIAALLKKSKSNILGSTRLPSAIDNSGMCSPIEDQGQIGSCTAQAVVGLMEYMMRASGSDHIDGSRLFVYKVTRKLLGWEGDTGAYLRTSMHTVAAFGVPPEEHWPYDINKYDEEPTPFLYSYADRFKALNYTRLDPVGSSPDDILKQIKRVLAANLCVVFGFTVYSSMSHLPNIPFPSNDDSQSGGHAVMAVGYDDNHEVNGKKVPSLIIRNSWGAGWGDGGYGYLPYDYVLAGLSRDFWTTFKWDWLETGRFG